MRFHEKLEKARKKVGIPFLTLTLWLSVIIATILVFIRDVNVDVYTPIITAVLPAFVLVLFLQDNKDSTKESVSIIPLVAAVLWVYLSIPLLNLHPLSSNFSLTAFFMYIFAIGIPIVILIRDNFWVRSGLDIHKINRELVLILLIGGSISFGFLISSILRFNPPIGQYQLEQLLAFVVLAPIFEEILFRGVIQDILTRRIGEPLNAISITAILFGLIHISSYSQLLHNQFDLVLVILVGPVAGGILYGSMKALTDSTIPGIIAHSIFNAIAVLSADRAEGFLFGILIFVLSMVLLGIYTRFGDDDNIDEQNLELEIEENSDEENKW